MGSGLTKPAVNVNEINYLKRVLQSDRSTSAFLKYLERNGKGCFLTLHLGIAQYKQTNNEYLLRRTFKDVCSSCDPYSSEISSWPQQLCKLITEIQLSQSATTDDIKNIEEFCNIHLSLESKDFVVSHEYKLMSESYANVEADRRVSELSKKLKNKYKNVLIIDDSPNNSQSLTFELESDGHSVRQANHGWIGSHIATLDHFDVILIDLAMNTMDPHEVIKRIKRNREILNGKLDSATLFIGLKYSAYDVDCHDIAFPIDVATLKSSKLLKAPSFISDFKTSIRRYEEISKSLGHLGVHFETSCCSSTSSFDGQ